MLILTIEQTFHQNSLPTAKCGQTMCGGYHEISFCQTMYLQEIYHFALYQLIPSQIIQQLSYPTLFMHSALKSHFDLRSLMNTKLLPANTLDPQTQQAIQPSTQSTQIDQFICHSITEAQQHYDNPTQPPKDRKSIDFSRFSQKELHYMLNKTLQMMSIYKEQMKRIPIVFKKQIAHQQRSFKQRLAQLSRLYPLPPQIPTDWELDLKFHDKSEILIRRSDVMTLLPCSDLNGWMINSHAEIVIKAMICQEFRKKVHCFNTYFFQLLVGGDGQGMGLEERVRKNYQSVKKWTHGVNVFEKEVIIIPMKIHRHWGIIVIHNIPSLLSKKESKGIPCILYFDSLQVKNKMVVEIVRLFLKIEFEDKCQDMVNATLPTFGPETLPDYQLLVPRQTNSNDSGIYSLATIEVILMSPETFRVNMGNPDNRNLLQLFSREYIHSMRSRMLKFYLKLQRQLVTNSKQSTPCQQIIQGAIKEYTEQRSRILQKGVLAKDYDYIYEEILLAYKKHTNGRAVSEEQKMDLKIRFHLDKVCNFYDGAKIE